MNYYITNHDLHQVGWNWRTHKVGDKIETDLLVERARGRTAFVVMDVQSHGIVVKPFEAKMGESMPSRLEQARGAHGVAVHRTDPYGHLNPFLGGTKEDDV